MDEQNTQICPCGSMIPHNACCGRFISGGMKPETAEQLMRSRYTAYALREYKYIVSTSYPTQRQSVSIASIKQWADELTWQKLEILETTSGTAKDKIGKVEFIAHYFQPASGMATLHERSRFKKHQGQWFYLDAE